MSVWRKLKYLLPSYRRAEERDMQEELESLAAIAGPRELGNLTLAAENARGVWGWAWLEGIVADVRYALRVLARRPSFTAVAVVSLALAIGANAAIFSLMDALLWRDLPVREPERLVLLERYSLSYLAYSRFARELRKRDGGRVCVVLGRIAPAGHGRRSATWDSGTGLGRVFPDPRIANAIGARHSAGGRPARPAGAGSAAEPRLLAARVWRRPRRGGPSDLGGAGAVHGDRRRSAGVFRP